MNTTEYRREPPISVRLTPENRERVEAFCSETFRSRNNAINYLLDQAFRAINDGDRGN